MNPAIRRALPSPLAACLPAATLAKPKDTTGNSGLYYHGNTLRLEINGEKAWESGFLLGAPPLPTLRLLNPGHPVSFGNLILLQPPKAK